MHVQTPSSPQVDGLLAQRSGWGTLAGDTDFRADVAWFCDIYVIRIYCRSMYHVVHVEKLQSA